MPFSLVSSTSATKHIVAFSIESYTRNPVTSTYTNHFPLKIGCSESITPIDTSTYRNENAVVSVHDEPHRERIKANRIKSAFLRIDNSSPTNDTTHLVHYSLILSTILVNIDYVM